MAIAAAIIVGYVLFKLRKPIITLISVLFSVANTGMDSIASKAEVALDATNQKLAQAEARLDSFAQKQKDKVNEKQAKDEAETVLSDSR